MSKNAPAISLARQAVMGLNEICKRLATIDDKMRADCERKEIDPVASFNGRKNVAR